MNPLRSLICLIICLLSTNILYSQELQFDSLTHDFGTIEEDGGTVTHVFKYKTIGSSPSVIVTAVSSCGCTVPVYTKKPVAVGAYSTIEVTYDPMDRPGKFSKTIQVVIAPRNKKYVLTISGDVNPREKSLEELYPYDMGGGLRLAGNYYPLSYIEQGERRELVVPYLNSSNSTIEVKLRGDENSKKLDYTPSLRIAAGEQGNLTMAYDMQKHRGYYGSLVDKFFVDVDGKESKYKLMLNAHAVDAVSPSDAAKAPIFELSTRIVQLGEVHRGSRSSKKSFTVENSGVSDLIFRRVECGVGIGSSLSDNTIIKAGGSRRVDVWCEGKQIDLGNFSRYITLTTNDPEAQMVRVRVTGTIVE